MERRLCPGCMNWKHSGFICEHCGHDERIPNEPHQLPVGTALKGQYIVGKVLGQGGFGITYLGYDQYLRQTVAIKEYYPTGLVMRDSSHSITVTNVEGQNGTTFESNLRRFLREAQSLAKLKEVPEVVQVRNFFPENGTAYIIMEFVQGITLKDHIRNQGLLSPDQAMHVFMPVMSGLQKVHEVGLVHRDISPDNIMLLPGGGVKLLDFGAVRDYNSELSQSTQAILKPGFAPVEQYRATSELGPWTDLYALCATMYYCMSGKLPPEAPERMMEGAEFQWNRIPGLTPVQLAALQKGTEILAKDRFQNVGEFHSALLADKPVTLRSAEATDKITQSPRKKPMGKILAAAAAVLAVLVGGGLLLSRGPAQTPDAPAVQVEDPLPETTVPETTVAEEAVPTPFDPSKERVYSLHSSGMHVDTYPCWVTMTDNGMTVTGPGLDISVTGRHVVATVYGLENEERYLCNRSESELYCDEFEWTFYMDSLFEFYMVTTGHTKLNRGPLNQTKTISEMEHILRLSDADFVYSFLSYLSSEAVSYDDHSITWEFDVPTTPADSGTVPEFKLDRFTGYRFQYREFDTDVMVDRTYTIAEGAEPEAYQISNVPFEGNHWETGTFTLTEQENQAVLSGKDLEVRLMQDGRMTVVLENLFLPESFYINVREYPEGDIVTENYWQLQLNTEDTRYSVILSSRTNSEGQNAVMLLKDAECGAFGVKNNAYAEFPGQVTEFIPEGNTLTIHLDISDYDKMLQILRNTHTAEVMASVEYLGLFVSRTYMPE